MRFLPDRYRSPFLLILLASLACGCAASAAKPTPPRATAECAAPAQWFDPNQGRPLAAAELQQRLATSRVVLLGETHERADHHLWQLQVAAALLAEGRNLVLAFEMLPRSGQAAVDRWLAGDIDEATFLVDSGFSSAWGMQADLYLPLFRFSRLNRLPMVALNIERDLVARVGDLGWRAIPSTQRAGLSDPAPPSAPYATWLGEIYAEHQAADGDPATAELARQRFIEAQLLWDRAFAEGITGALLGHPEATVVGIIGTGHLQHGYGVPHQLADLGIQDVSVLLPWDGGSDCGELVPGLATAVFGTEPLTTPLSPRPRLGVLLESTAAGVRVAAVTTESIAAAAGLRVGDILLQAAGERVGSVGELQAIIARQAPGTWLPLRVQRDHQDLELIARFPARPE